MLSHISAIRLAKIRYLIALNLVYFSNRALLKEKRAAGAQKKVVHWVN
jgi:hypothetical protein